MISVSIDFKIISSGFFFFCVYFRGKLNLNVETQIENGDFAVVVNELKKGIVLRK